MRTGTTMAIGVLLLLASLSVESAGAWSAPAGSAQGTAIVGRAPTPTPEPDSAPATIEGALETAIVPDDAPTATGGEVNTIDAPATATPDTPVDPAIEARPHGPGQLPPEESSSRNQGENSTSTRGR